MPDREVTIGELADDVTHLTAAVERLSQAIETTYVRKDVYDLAHTVLVDMVHLNNQRHDTAIRAIEARQTWIGRTAVTALLLPLITGVVVALLLGAIK
jgi:thiamine monophosphate synthase